MASFSFALLKYRRLLYQLCQVWYNSVLYLRRYGKIHFPIPFPVLSNLLLPVSCHSLFVRLTGFEPAMEFYLTRLRVWTSRPTTDTNAFYSSIIFVRLEGFEPTMVLFTRQFKRLFLSAS